MTELHAGDFSAFFRAIHGYDPFPWQKRLAERVCRGEGWPEVMDLPTASGKTAAIDVAVFAMALRQRGPRRVFFVVDRRVVVDAAYERMQKIAKALREAGDGVLGTVKARLQAMAGGEEPLFAYSMRGGIYRDDTWVRSPLQPAVIASTVDQVGSRLLFRGYGVSKHAHPIHAALVGNDSLILLDEAHCSRAFAKTLGAVRKYRGWVDEDLGASFEFVEMTATPARETADRFVLDAEDLAHPLLRQRLTAPKPARLVVSKARAKDFGKLAEELAREALAMAQKPGLRRIAVMVNRVKTARLVFQELGKKGKAHLLIGRMRPFDRAKLPGDVEAMLSGEKRRPGADPVFVVATQCLEVGADLDFDAIVTECASIDAILQRFGRLDRIGQLSSLGGAAEGCIVAAGPATQAGFEDPVYGKALAATWNWLQGCEGLDFALVREEGESIRERLAAMGEAASELRKQDVISPVLLPAHLDLLVQTSPAPALEPDIALFLHGLERGAPEVQVVWRGDLDLGRTEDWAEIVGMCPPVAAEAMPATLRDFRAWISGGDAAGLADVEGTAEAEEATGERLRCPVLVWQGEDSWVVDRLEDVGRIPAWTTVVLATESEGWDELGHKPRDAAGDVAEAARAMLRRGTVVRLHPALIEKWPESDGRGELLEKVKGQDLDADEAVELLEKCSGLDWLTTMLAKPGKPGLERYPGKDKDSEVVGWILRWPSAEADAGGDESSSGGAVFLDKHLEDVGREVADLAGELIPGERERGALVRAARLHDVGKADVRFQARLRGGDLLAAQFATKMLAKGIVARRDGKAVDGSGLPKGFRHELLSLLLAQKDEGAAGDELALHLIASHHGRCRPFAPVVPDEGVDAAHGGLRIGRREREERAAHRLDSGVADRFWRLTRRYGWWGLAWLEAVLRLGDWKASKEEVEKQS